MSWSWDEYQVLLRSTLKVSIKPKDALLDSFRFKADAYDPPLEMGLPQVCYTLIPGLHAYSATGNKILIHDRRFLINMYMN